VADLLAQSGVPFRTAHKLVAGAADRSDDPSFADLDAACETVLGESLTAYVPREDIEEALDPAESVAMRDSRGGPAPDTVAAHLSRAVETLAEESEAVEVRREAIAAAARRLETEVERYV